MKISNTSKRLQQLMFEQNLKQVDILTKAKPYCEKYDIRLGKNDLSQYVSGKVEPGSEKLTILGLALNVSEVWLMGYDVPPDRTSDDRANLLLNQMYNPESFNIKHAISTSTDEDSIEYKYNLLDKHGKRIVDLVVEEELRRVKECSIHTKDNGDYIPHVAAAHTRDGMLNDANREDIKKMNAIVAKMKKEQNKDR